MITKILALALTLASLTAFAHDGAGSGGGGFTSPANRMSVKEMGQLIGPARMHLLMYLNYHDQNRHMLPEEFKGLFGDEDNKNFAYMVKYRLVHVNDTTPCYDQNGKERDGSIYRNDGKQGVCISTFNLSQKIRSDAVQTQLVALMAHEYSHLLGTNETQANKIQKYVLNYMPKWSPNATSHVTNSYHSSLSGARQDINTFIQNLNRLSWQDACYFTNELVSNLSPFFYEGTYMFFSPLNLTNTKWQARIHSGRHLVENLAFGACGLAFGPNSMSNRWNRQKEDYNHAFKFSKTVPVLEFLRVMDRKPVRLKYDERVMITKIENIENFKAELTRVAIYLSQFESVFMTLRDAENNVGSNIDYVER